MALFGDPIATNQGLNALGVDQFYSSTPDVLNAVGADTLATNATSLLARGWNRFISNSPEVPIDGETAQAMISTGNAGPNQDGLTMPNQQYVPSPLLTPEEANQKYGIRTGDKSLLSWSEPVRENEAKELSDLKHQELARQDIINRGRGGFFQGLAKLTVGAGATMVDPLNLLSAFVPVVGEARAASWLARAGESFLPRAATRAGIGAIEGIAGASMLEPATYGLSQAEQRDYTFVDSLSNLAFGGVIGGGLHAGFGAIGDRINGISKVIDRAPPQVKQAMLGDAITATMEDRPVRADLALREHLLSGTSLRSAYEQSMLNFDNAVGPFGPPERDIGFDLGGNVSTELPHPVPDRNGSAVPIINDRGHPLAYTTRTRAENAVDRVERIEGYRPEIAETSDGFVLRRDSQIEPVRSRDGTPMTFENQRQAERYRDQILKDPNLDAIPVSDGGPVRYGLVAGASERELTGARAHPEAVDLRVSRDVPNVLADNAQSIRAQREQFMNEISGWVQSKLNPEVRATPRDLAVLAEDNARFERSQGEAHSITREGGQTERTLIEKELDDLDAQIKSVQDVGELPAEDKAEIDAANQGIVEADKRSALYDRIAGCIRGT